MLMISNGDFLKLNITKCEIVSFSRLCADGELLQSKVNELLVPVNEVGKCLGFGGRAILCVVDWSRRISARYRDPSFTMGLLVLFRGILLSLWGYWCFLGGSEPLSSRNMHATCSLWL